MSGNNDVGEEKDEDMSLDDRVEWLRERGVQIETPEERKRQQVAKIMKQPDPTSDNNDNVVKYVLVPADTSQPLQEFAFQPSTISGSGDLLLEHLKSVFQSSTSSKSNSNSNIDIELLKKHTMSTIACSSNLPEGTTVSDTTLQQVAADAHVEVFSLVKPLPANNYTGINIYLDEIGMLKRLPLNKRASDYAYRAGYSPPPTFYGDVFFGRVQNRPILKNISFHYGTDTTFDSPWLLAATNDNLSYQMEMNTITGQKDVRQPTVAGTDGISKEENGYTWTQTESELEVIFMVPSDTTSKDVTVKFQLQKLQVQCKKDTKILIISLFECIDLDSCTWTIEKNIIKNNNTNSTSNDEKQNKRLIISMEKQESAFWPRIED